MNRLLLNWKLNGARTLVGIDETKKKKGKFLKEKRENRI